MKSLEQEAHDYNPVQKLDAEFIRVAFIAGANSKWVQAEKIKAQIEVLKETLKECEDDYIFILLNKKEQQLKELEDENTMPSS